MTIVTHSGRSMHVRLVTDRLGGWGIQLEPSLGTYTIHLGSGRAPFFYPAERGDRHADDP